MIAEPPPPKRRRRWLAFLAAALGVVVAIGIVGAIVDSQHASSPAPAPAAPTRNLDSSAAEREPLVFTYFFYWYDAETMAHLDPASGLPTTLPADPAPSWRSVDWFRKELSDMADAGIDVVLPVYWGDTEPWSVDGLLTLAEAKRQLADEGKDVPDVGLFFDTTILNGRDLTQPEGKAYFYDQIRMFFDRVPRDQWTLIDGSPVIWLYFAFFASAFDQTTFDYIYESFERDYGVRPYIVRELSWDFAVSNDGGRIVDEDRPIATEANYKWGAAFDIAAAGPGFDEREIPGRGNAYRPRDDGAWYFQNFGKAIDSRKRMIVIETWNEIHEASGIGETVEFGRTYIDLTRALTDEYRSQLTTSP
ncbi:MAG: DUF5010 domain-containing protein [Dehalococcoidia bacterium]